jgi:uncharacterized protein (TIGR03083 family)
LGQNAAMGELQKSIRSERLDLLDFLEKLEPADWAVPSLCSEWTVQDVAAHVAWAPALRPVEVIGRAIRGGFRMNRLNTESAREWAARGREAILAQLRVTAEKGLRPPGTPESAALADVVVHAVDIRRPLGRSAQLDPATFRLVADFFTGLRWPLTITIGGNAREVIKGLRLVADDLDWSCGAGPEVRGPAEALLRVLTGRPVSADELSGPGAGLLRTRL